MLRLPGLALVCALSAIGCATPTLPLPPPAELSVSAPDPVTGLVTVSGNVLPGAYVFCFNELAEQGVIVVADDMGHFELQVPAEVGDALTLWQRRGTDRSIDVHLVVRMM